ncbi:MAG: hypothetical protein JRH01_04150 [Deltaproteobacteria bacterium]|nr:hypothetical protein [Deltaproteobacteria bacterium]MBW2394966.1 hypothetical protein [Deltaproteobacteria bacterium]
MTSESTPQTSLRAVILANVFVLGALALAAALESRDPAFHYRSLQEDGAVEWLSFWAFLLASAVNLVAAMRQRQQTQRLPWFLGGLALFCFFVAMEEISWGQRVLGFRPPTYFLEHNFQQEANFHNVVDTGLRKLALTAVIGGYGVVLPLLMLIPPLGRWLRRMAVVGPPTALIPAFAAALVTYRIYPWKFTGEIVEAMLGLGFLFAATVRTAELGRGETSRGGGKTIGAVAVSGLLVVALGLACDAASRSRQSADPGTLVAARLELDALRRDLDAHGRDRGARRDVRCGLHKRLYGLVQDRGAEFLLGGEFAGLVDRGLPEQRASFLIDPWSTAYWIRFECEGKRRSLFLYSFGPNRLRDSTEWEILGDDVGVYLVGPPEPELPAP